MGVFHRTQRWKIQRWKITRAGNQEMKGQCHQTTIYSILLSFSGAIKSTCIFPTPFYLSTYSFPCLSVYISPKFTCRNYLVVSESKFSIPSKQTLLTWTQFGWGVHLWSSHLWPGGGVTWCKHGCQSPMQLEVVTGSWVDLPSLCLSSFKLCYSFTTVPHGMFSIASNRILND